MESYMSDNTSPALIGRGVCQELRIPHTEVDLIQAELEANKPYEACGLMIGTINDFIANVEKTPPNPKGKRTKKNFELCPQQFYKSLNETEKNGKEIVGVYHTHPVSCAIPSHWDMETIEKAPL